MCVRSSTVLAHVNVRFKPWLLCVCSIDESTLSVSVRLSEEDEDVSVEVCSEVVVSCWGEWSVVTVRFDDEERKWGDKATAGCLPGDVVPFTIVVL